MFRQLVALGALALASHASGAPAQGRATHRHLGIVGSASTLDDLGAPYIYTTPLVGPTVQWDAASAVRAQLPRRVCAPMAAASERHMHWYDGLDGESLDKYTNQVSAESAFMRDITERLCVDPTQSSDAYYATVHNMTAEVRKRINRHVHSAFWVKAVCAIVDDFCYDASARNVDAPTTFPTLRFVQGCSDTLLEHERYNLAEGETFVNISTSLLTMGPSFCSSPTRDAKIARWSREMSESQEYHSGNHAFDELSESFMTQVCTEPDEYEGQYDEVYEAVSQLIDADVLAGTLGVDGLDGCTFSDEAFAALEFVKSNPPSAADLITIIAGNAKLTMNAGAATVESVATHDGYCMDPETGERNEDTMKHLLSQLKTLGLPERDGNGSAASAQPNAFVLPTIYHKILVNCLEPAEDGTFEDVCLLKSSSLGKHVYTNFMMGAQGLSNPVFDLITSTDIKRCNGEACAKAARAVSNYHAMLTTITRLRTDTNRVYVGAPTSFPGGTFFGAKQWTWQRNCAALRQMTESAVELHEMIGTVVADLTDALPQLEPSCVSPSRDDSKLTKGMLSVLSKPTAVHYHEVWNASETLGMSVCGAVPDAYPASR